MSNSLDRQVPFTVSRSYARDDASETFARTSESVVPRTEVTRDGFRPVVHVIDDEREHFEALTVAVAGDGATLRSHATCEDFLQTYRPGRDGCVLVDAGVRGIGCLEFVRRLADLDHCLPVIIVMGDKDVSIVVKAMKAGVLEFIEKPIDTAELRGAVHRVLVQSHDAGKLRAWRQAATNRLAALTPRQRQVLTMILDGAPNKNIAADLQVSQRTVESHRASIMRKTGSHSLPELARLAFSAVAYSDTRRRTFG